MEMETDFSEAEGMTTKKEPRWGRMPVWYEVPRRIKSFTGRVEDIEKLHTSILKQNMDPSLLTAIVGIDGIGKTTLAAEYVWTHQHINSIWINSKSYYTIKESFEQLADELKINLLDSNGHSLTLENLVLRLYESFVDTHGNVLIVFDNVDCIEDIQLYLPNVKTKPFFRVILTSREIDWTVNVSVTVIHLKPFNVNESVELLRNFLRLKTQVEYECGQEISLIHMNIPSDIRQVGSNLKKLHSKIPEKPLEIHMKEYIDYCRKMNKDTKTMDSQTR